MEKQGTWCLLFRFQNPPPPTVLTFPAAMRFTQISHSCPQGGWAAVHHQWGVGHSSSSPPHWEITLGELDLPAVSVRGEPVCSADPNGADGASLS